MGRGQDGRRDPGRSGPRTLVATVIVAIALTTLLISALSVQAGRKQYDGSVSNTPGRVHFVLKREHGKLEIRNWHASKIPWSCPGGVANTGFDLEEIKVNRQRHFHIKRFDDNPRGPTTVVLDGRLQEGGRASGTLSKAGDFDTLLICDTGTLEWKAKR